MAEKGDAETPVSAEKIEEIRTAGRIAFGALIEALDARKPAPAAEPLEGRWVTCEAWPEPHRWTPFCSGVVQLVPAPYEDDEW